MDTVRDTDELPRQTLWLMAAACGAAAANIYYNQPLLGDFATYFKATATEASYVAVAAQTGYGLGMLFFLPLADLLERGRLVLTLVTTCAVLLLGTALAPNLPFLVALQLLVGMTAMSPQILIPLAVEMTASEKRGHTVGILMGGLLGGILLARTVSGFVGDHFGWRVMFGLAAVLMVAVALFLRTGLPRRTPTLKMRYGPLMLSLWHLLRTQPKLWAPSLVSALTFGSFTAFWTALSFLMVSRFHRGATEAGLFGVVGLIGALGAPLAGKLSDRKGVAFTVTIALVCSFVAFALMGIWVTIPVLVVGVLLMDLGVQSIQVAEQAKVISLLPEARSRINTIYMVARFTGGAGGSAIAGIVWAKYHWTGVCVAAIGLTVLGFLIHLLETAAEAHDAPSPALQERGATRENG